ncbi:MAG: S9 family peptidase, partial [Shewanella sp.]
MTKNGLASSLRAVKLGASSLLIASQLAMISSLTTASAYALEGGMTPLTIERMNASPALAGTSPRGLKLSPDGQRVTYLAGRKDNQNFYDLWQMDVKTGKSSL